MDSYFIITGAKPLLIFHYLNTIFIDEAATQFQYNFGKVDPSTLTWATVKTILFDYFIRPNHMRQLHDQWAKAHQIESVQEYHSYLTRIAMQLNTINEKEFIDKFIYGLKSNT